jgi:putative OmpL-like beta-barrel porin-2
MESSVRWTPMLASLRGFVICVAAGAAVARPATAQSTSDWQYGGFVDVGYLNSFNDPTNHLFRSRGTTPRVDEWDVDMTAAWLKKIASDRSRIGIEVTAQTGEDSKVFGFSSTAPNIDDAETLRHFGPTNVSYLAPVGKGLTIQGGIFSSLIGYDSLYAKDNFSYTRPWGADYTPYLMLGVNASYAASEKLTGTVALVNGYWHLAHANDAPSVVGQLAYKANDRLSLKETVLYGSHQPSTGIEFWRVLSDTIVERKAGRVTTAFEYQLGSEKLDAPAGQRALWTSAQLPIHWTVRGPWSLTVRPEFAWDRDGRWIAGELGAEQSITAITTTLEYRMSYRGAQGVLRLEHRYDNSQGTSGGFFDDGDLRPGVARLTPGQHLLIVGLIVTFDSSTRQ